MLGFDEVESGMFVILGLFWLLLVVLDFLGFMNLIRSWIGFIFDLEWGDFLRSRVDFWFLVMGVV